MRPTSALTFGLLSASALLSLPAWSQAPAVRIYCCDDANGSKLCGDFLPKACESRAYEERDNKGYVVNKVEAPLTAEQQARRTAELEKKQAEEKGKAEERRRNLALLSTYATEADIDAARDRALREVDKLIKLAEQAVAEAEKNLTKANNEKEFYKGKTIPADLKSKLRDLEASANAKRTLLAAKKREIGEVKAKYEDERKKYRELKGIAASAAAKPAAAAEAQPAAAAAAPPAAAPAAAPAAKP